MGSLGRVAWALPLLCALYVAWHDEPAREALSQPDEPTEHAPTPRRATVHDFPAATRPAQAAQPRPPDLPEAPDVVRVRVRDAYGKPITEAYAALELAEPEGTPSETATGSTDADGYVALELPDFSALSPALALSLTVSASGFASARVDEDALLGSGDDAYAVVLTALVPVTLAVRCPRDLGDDTPLVLGFYSDHGSDVARAEVTCDENGFAEAEFEAPPAGITFAALHIHPRAPKLATLHVGAGGSYGARIVLTLAPAALSVRQITLTEQHGRPVSDAYVEIQGKYAPHGQRSRWLNGDDTLSDADGRFSWLSEPGADSLLSISVGASEPIDTTLPSQARALRLPALAMVRCRFVDAKGAPAPFYGVGYASESRDDDSAGFGFQTFGSNQVDLGAGRGEYSFAWPQGAEALRISSDGFGDVLLRAPTDPCTLMAPAGGPEPERQHPD